MLFDSAAFMFLFLPVALTVFSLTPEKHKRTVLLGVSIAFYLLANIKTLVAIPLIFACALLTHVTGRRLAREHNMRLCIDVSITIALVFIIFRLIYEITGGLLTFPLGLAVFTLSCVSFLFDVVRGDAEPGKFTDTLLYITFFPVMAAGPVIKYKDFTQYIGHISQSVNSFADGARLFAVGFIERIAISAVLFDAYERIMSISGMSLSLFFELVCAVLIFISAFFAFAGWMDMGRGIALMFGIRLGKGYGDAPVACTPVLYFKRLFAGLADFIDDYISPMAFGKIGKRLGGALSSALCVLVCSIWIRTSIPVLVTSAVIAAVVFVFSYFGVDSFFGKGGFRGIPGWILTFFLAAVFWSACISDSFAEFINLFGSLSLKISDYHTYYAHIATAGGKYIASGLAACASFAAIRYLPGLKKKLSDGGKTVFDAVITVVILGGLVFTVLYYMPQYPQYAARAFAHIVF